jgi:opacity protein-like surface antigen
MKIHPLLGALSVACAAAYPLAAAAQQTPVNPATPGTSTDAAREALAPKEGDSDQSTLLKQTLTAVDKQYSLLKRGKTQATYDFNYTYIGQEKINADLSSGTLTLFNIENDSSHAITNTLTMDYGLKDNLTTSLSLPIVSKYSQNPNFDGISHSLGDIGLGARWQPIETQRGHPSATLTGMLRLPTGRSPFKVDANKGLATGSGVTSFTGGVNVNHIVDPVALFGSINFTASSAASHLSQQRNGETLRKVKPGLGFGFGFGFAYALSYDITTSVSLQESISAGSKLTLDNGTTTRTIKTNTQTAGILNFGLGYRISPKTTINITVGIGLTSDSPNMSIGLSMPLSL